MTRLICMFISLLRAPVHAHDRSSRCPSGTLRQNRIPLVQRHDVQRRASGYLSCKKRTWANTRRILASKACLKLRGGLKHSLKLTYVLEVGYFIEWLQALLYSWDTRLPLLPICLFGTAFKSHTPCLTDHSMDNIFLVPLTSNPFNGHVREDHFKEFTTKTLFSCKITRHHVLLEWVFKWTNLTSHIPSLSPYFPFHPINPSTSIYIIDSSTRHTHQHSTEHSSLQHETTRAIAKMPMQWNAQADAKVRSRSFVWLEKPFVLVLILL